MRVKGIRDKDLVKLLQLVDLDWMIISESVASSTSKNDDKDKTTQLEGFEQVWKDSNVENGEDNKTEEQELRTLGQKRSWDSMANWMDVLSGGL